MLLTLALDSPAQDRSPAAMAWWSHVQYLAADKLQGRKPGSQGFRDAVAYVSDQFQQAGLKPGGVNGYEQPVTFRVRQYVEEGSAIELKANGKTEVLKLGEEANLVPRGIPGKRIKADAVFVGHGLQIPEAGIDDLKGVQLKGKIAVFLLSAPKSLPGALSAHAQSVAERWGNLRRAGAIGVASISNPRTAELSWARTTSTRFQPSFSLTEAALEDQIGMQVQISINAAHADRFFAGTGRTVAELFALDAAGKELPRFPLKIKVRATTQFTMSEIQTCNVVGLHPGSDPALQNEYVLISAHLDHLGVGPAIEGDSIYNGAMDNASGIASMIEAAKLLRHKKLGRGVLFVALTGEENGLLGSKYFAAHPTVRFDALVADINMDMFLPIVPLKALSVQGIEESDLGPEFARVAEKFGVQALPDPEPERRRFIRSDQYSFIGRGIPSLAFKVYAALKSPEHLVMQDWLTRRYHAPSDDLQQPVDLEGAAKFTQILAAMIEDVSLRADRPRWNSNSFFRRFAVP